MRPTYQVFTHQQQHASHLTLRCELAARRAAGLTRNKNMASTHVNEKQCTLQIHSQNEWLPSTQGAFPRTGPLTCGGY
eukprot:60811-Chlamydomonas_euryale.AAC.15